MGLAKKKSDKSQKGTVSISNYKNGLRLRWRLESKRQALYITSSVASFQKIAHVIKGVIERDILICDFDESLERYREILQKAALHDSTLEHQILPAVYTPEKRKAAKKAKIDTVSLYNDYLAAKEKAELNLSSYYYDTRQMSDQLVTITFKFRNVVRSEPFENDFLSIIIALN